MERELGRLCCSCLSGDIVVPIWFSCLVSAPLLQLRLTLLLIVSSLYGCAILFSVPIFASPSSMRWWTEISMVFCLFAFRMSHLYPIFWTCWISKWWGSFSVVVVNTKLNHTLNVLFLYWCFKLQRWFTVLKTSLKNTLFVVSSMPQRRRVVSVGVVVISPHGI